MPKNGGNSAQSTADNLEEGDTKSRDKLNLTANWPYEKLSNYADLKLKKRKVDLDL